MIEVKTPIDIGEIFKNYIKIDSKVMAIEALFANKKRFDKTNFKPPYQRNYVWNDEKASYFIESILLGTEIPPLIFFNSGGFNEVIDGRQRYETIYRFLNNHFKLKKGGLLKLKDLANKQFKDLNELKDTIWDTKLRIIEFSFHSKPETNYDIEDVVKKEIFKRYNTGITPLKPTEIDKAKYIDDDLNRYIKKALKNDQRLYDFIIETFYFDNDNIETVLKKVRQLLVQHRIPINYYATKKQEVISKYYELLSESINHEDDIKSIFNNFVRKINFISEVKKSIEREGGQANRLVFECLYWGLSVTENEGIPFSHIDDFNFKKKVSKYLSSNISNFKTDRSSFSEQIFERYSITATFFEESLNLSFKNYIVNHEAFKRYNKSLLKEKTDSDTLLKFESLRLNKPDASSNSIEDISRQMERQRFLVRPIYQRNEVINKNKSSAIIESILLGIKLPPIFVFKRSDGISEVIDGQQRLLSILGFLGKEYLDENKNLVKSEKDRFSLNLQNGILKDLHRKKFSTLSELMQERIEDFNLWVIEIDEKNNPAFDPVDLFIRLNYKPYPIKENTFEMWNSYVDREIIDYVKSLYKKNNDWFYLRKNNTRMDNEGLIIYLIYLQYKFNSVSPTLEGISTFLDVYKIGDKINIRIKSKNDITKILDSPDSISSFTSSFSSFENSFFAKLKALIFINENDSDKIINERLDTLMNKEHSIRTYQNFYTLWLLLSNINLEKVKPNRDSITQNIKSIFDNMSKVNSKDEFERSVNKFWKNYQ
ncbi:DUF262 domain-containing protein [Catalinimonas niigatensis]|uniref:DUF262 domain-containing protein n=1 Tax=Catalinimonas niigatensis TaxID=1397264 RepID=UPI0026655CBC|nr:DUF262 domain-containing protein [Catalinimonas niigatensis]WPP49655.1 DUF262 domain-containing protein [Catalinimonas niigatensis]